MQVDGGGRRWEPRAAPARPGRPHRAQPDAGRVRLAPRDAGRRGPASRRSSAPTTSTSRPTTTRRSRTHPATSPAPGTRTGRWRRWRTRAYPFRLAVQWHPEAGDDGRLFDAFVSACARFAAGVGDTDVVRVPGLAIAAGGVGPRGLGRQGGASHPGRHRRTGHGSARRPDAGLARVVGRHASTTSSCASSRRRARSPAASRSSSPAARSATPSGTCRSCASPLRAQPVGTHVTWLGHSTVLVQVDGAVVLLDPVWSDRCSPSPQVGPAPAPPRAGGAARPAAGRRRRHLARPLRPPRHGLGQGARRAAARDPLRRAARRRRPPREVGRRRRPDRRARLARGRQGRRACASSRRRRSTSPGAGCRATAPCGPRGSSRATTRQGLLLGRHRLLRGLRRDRRALRAVRRVARAGRRLRRRLAHDPHDARARGRGPPRRAGRA